MRHFGAICNPGPSHVMIMGALGRELQKRGHRFTLFATPELAASAAKHQISFGPLENASRYMPNLELYLETATRDGGSWREILANGIGQIEFYCEEAPRAMQPRAFNA